MARRWEHLVPALSEDLAPNELQALLMEVYRRRARRQTPAGLMQRAQAPLCAPSGADARLMHSFDECALRAASAFEAIELAPVCPLGLSQVLGGIDQNNVLTSIRTAEVLGDSTPMLALECARRRRPQVVRAAGLVRLCASHRVLRLQTFDVPGFTPHFRLFALADAGRDTGSDAFEIQYLREHLCFYLELFRALNGAGFTLRAPLIEVGDVSATEAMLAAAGVSREEVREAVRAHRPGSAERFLASRGIALPHDAAAAPEPQRTRLFRVEEEVFAPLAADFPEAEFRVNLSRLEGMGYYTGLCLRVSPQTGDGERFPVVDGGFTNWTARLLEDRKERFLASGIGTEFVCKRYAATRSPRAAPGPWGWTDSR